MNKDIKFTYDGISRYVSNVTFEGTTLIGYEMRRGGKFSYKVKRYAFDKIKGLIFIPEIHRSGPTVGKPV